MIDHRYRPYHKPDRNEVNKVLNKVRAEIEDLDVYYDNDYFCGNKDAMYKCNEVLEIIDRFRNEVSK